MCATPFKNNAALRQHDCNAAHHTTPEPPVFVHNRAETLAVEEGLS
jgi:hypothetical protein